MRLILILNINVAGEITVVNKLKEKIEIIRENSSDSLEAVEIP